MIKQNFCQKAKTKAKWAKSLILPMLRQTVIFPLIKNPALLFFPKKVDEICLHGIGCQKLADARNCVVSRLRIQKLRSS